MKKGATDAQIANFVNGSRYGRRPNLHNGGHENGKVNSSNPFSWCCFVLLPTLERLWRKRAILWSAGSGGPAAKVGDAGVPCC